MVLFGNEDAEGFLSIPQCTVPVDLRAGAYVKAKSFSGQRNVNVFLFVKKRK